MSNNAEGHRAWDVPPGGPPWAGYAASPAARVRLPVSHGRELAAAGIMVAIWVLIGFALSGARTTGASVQNYGMFVDAGVLAVLALLIGAFGATSRRWIALVPGLLVPVQAGAAVYANEFGEDLLFGWLMPSSFDSELSLLPNLAGSSLPLVVAIVAWVYGFGRRPWGLVMAGAGALILFGVRGWLMLEFLPQIMSSPLVELLLAHIAVPAVFATVVFVSFVAGSSAITVEATGAAADPDSGPRGGNIAATLGMLVALYLLVSFQPMPVPPAAWQVLLTVAVVAAIVAARDRRLPVSIAAILLWGHYLLVGQAWVYIRAEGLSLGGGLLDRPPLPVVAWVITYSLPSAALLAAVWALLRCARMANVMTAVAVVVGIQLLVDVVEAARWWSLSVSMWGVDVVLFQTMTYVAIALVVHWRVRREAAEPGAPRSAQTPRPAQPAHTDSAAPPALAPAPPLAPAPHARQPEPQAPRSEQHSPRTESRPQVRYWFS